MQIQHGIGVHDGMIRQGFTSLLVSVAGLLQVEIWIKGAHGSGHKSGMYLLECNL